MGELSVEQRLKVRLSNETRRADAAEREVERLRLILYPPDQVERVTRAIHRATGGSIRVGPPTRRKVDPRGRLSAAALAEIVLEAAAPGDGEADGS